MKIYTLSGDLMYSWEDSEFNKDNDLDGLDLSFANLQSLDLEGVILTGTRFNNADLSAAKLYWAVFLDCELENSILEKADLRGAKLIRCNVKNANLRSADLGPDAFGSPSSLDGSDFTGADLTSANLRSATIDGNTKFPDGFDVAGFGLRMRGDVSDAMNRSGLAAQTIPKRDE